MHIHPKIQSDWRTSRKEGERGVTVSHVHLPGCCAAMEDYVVYDEIGRSANTTVYKGRKTV